MDDTKRQKIGRLGEDLACTFLKKRGFYVVERNYRKKCGELDIVAENNDGLRFVEVKTVARSSGTALDSEDYEPEDNVHLWKRRRLGRIIQIYLLEREISDDTDWQIDVISVYLDGAGRELRVDWLEDVVL